MHAMVESQIEKTIREYMGDDALRVLQSVGKVAAKQGGASTLENYQLLGKRALIALGAALAVASIATSIGGLVLSRVSEKKRVEKLVRQILEEERLKETDGQRTDGAA